MEKRNQEIYLKKRGYDNLKNKKVVNTPITYRKLVAEYNLCQSRLQQIVSSFEEDK